MRAAILAVLLTGCASHAQIQRVEVPVPVVRPCVTSADIPQQPPLTLKAGENVERQAAAVSIDLRRMTGYAASLRTLLQACAEQ